MESGYLATTVIFSRRPGHHAVVPGAGAVRHKDRCLSSPYQIVLSGEEEAVLAARARSARGPYRDRLRAGIVLAAAAGQDNAAIAGEMGVCTDTVRKWRRRFAAAGCRG